MKYNFESGRSMVEMLGTLAIIGVLSVGGIAGYSYGMDKYRANETINDVNLRGIDLVRQVAMNQSLSLSDWPTTSKAGYTISDPVLSAEGDAYFSISGVPQRICEMVYAGIQNNQTTDVEVNEYVAEDSSACDKAEDNKMGFFFITNAGEGGTTVDELCKNITCPEGNSCTHGICMSEELPSFGTGGTRACSKDVVCPECQTCDGVWCVNKANGTQCTGGNCEEGKCILNDQMCSSHLECETGYFCDADSLSSVTNRCVKLEFYKIKKGIYISKIATRATGLCELAGFFPLTKEQLVSVASDIDGTPYFHLPNSIPCLKDGVYCNPNELAHEICADDSSDLEYTQPEITSQ